MNRSRRARSPSYRFDPRLNSEYEEAFDHRIGSYDHLPPQAPQQAPPGSQEPPFPAPSDGYARHHSHNLPYSSHRIPSTYRTTMRETPASYQAPPAAGSPSYKILCITNINSKISDAALKEALINDFSRFGDISVSICLDSGERLVYIYFRTYEEAREARRAKTRSILFDRPIEIEPIYENASPSYSPPPQSTPAHAQVSHRRSVTPPDYYPSSTGQLHHPSRYPAGPVGPNQHVTMSPGYIDSPRYPPSVPMPPMNIPPSGRHHHRPPPHYPQLPMSPYSSPPHDAHRGYPGGSPIHHGSQVPMYHPGSYGYGPMIPPRDRDPYVSRSPYYPEPPRGYDYPAATQHMPRDPAMMHSSNMGPYPYPVPVAPNGPPMHHHRAQPIASSRRSPPQAGAEHPGRYYSREFRREKLGENVTSDRDESKPSRVIFVANIDSSKTEDEIREIFQAFGTMEDFELKKTSQDSSSALIKFSSMDCAYKAKTANNGKHIGGSKCRIFYGKISASRRLWLGGLGPTTTLESLSEEFGKFGDILSLEYVSGRPYAYVEFESANQAQFATMHLKGNMIAGAERRIRIEYVDPEKKDKISRSEPTVEKTPVSRNSRERWASNSDLDASPKQAKKRSPERSPENSKRIHLSNSDIPNSANQTLLTNQLDQSQDSNATAQSPSVEKSSSETRERNNNRETILCNDHQETINNNNPGDKKSDHAEVTLAKCQYISEITEACEASWLCQLVLRNFNFQSKLHMCSGDKSVVESIILKSNGKESDSQCPIFKITQRWRLNPQPKLEEVRRRMHSANSGIFIITSRSEQSPSVSPSCKTPQSSWGNATKQNGDKDTPTDNKSEANESSLTSQSRPIKNLISYLEQKDAAGVVSLNSPSPNQSEGSKLLYAFPPCEFALNMLRRVSPNLSDEAIREEFLLGVIVSNCDSKI